MQKIKSGINPFHGFSGSKNIQIGLTKTIFDHKSRTETLVDMWFRRTTRTFITFPDKINEFIFLKV